MPTDMTSEESERFVNEAHEIETYEFRKESDADDFFTAILYRTSGGRHFRHVDSSGMNSFFHGANLLQWLDDEEVLKWKEF